MLIDFLPVWLLFFIAIALVMLSVEGGFLLGRTFRATSADETESPASSISGVILGLQAFMLAFTFGIVSERYDTKKSLVREEANAIRAAFSRSDFLAEPDREKTKLLLKDYVKQRVALAQSRDLSQLGDALANARQIQLQLWDIVLVNGRKDLNSDIGALLIESVNEIEEIHAMRVGIALNSRIPTTIWIVLMSLLILGMVAVGYHTAIADSRRSRVAPVLAVAFAMVIALIAALDHPGDGLVPVPQQPLISVLSEMEAAASTPR